MAAAQLKRRLRGRQSAAKPRREVGRAHTVKDRAPRRPAFAESGRCSHRFAMAALRLAGLADGCCRP
jgi:hypothetical protein